MILLAGLLALALLPLVAPSADARLPSQPRERLPQLLRGRAGARVSKYYDDPAEDCVAAPPNPHAALSFPANWHDEAFRWLVESEPLPVRFRLALEGAFATSAS